MGLIPNLVRFRYELLRQKDLGMITFRVGFFEAVGGVDVVGGRVVLVARLGVEQGQGHEGLTSLKIISWIRKVIFFILILAF